MEQLLEQWVNGNRKMVVEYLLTMRKANAMQMAVRLTRRMSDDDVAVFLKLVAELRKA